MRPQVTKNRENDMIKKIIAVVLIVLTGGGWFYLDYLNKQQLQEAEELRAAMEQARAQALTHQRSQSSSSLGNRQAGSLQPKTEK
jgi:Tfp pilus assembly protein FimT